MLEGKLVGPGVVSGVIFVCAVCAQVLISAASATYCLAFMRSICFSFSDKAKFPTACIFCGERTFVNIVFSFGPKIIQQCRFRGHLSLTSETFYFIGWGSGVIEIGLFYGG